MCDGAGRQPIEITRMQITSGAVTPRQGAWLIDDELYRPHGTRYLALGQQGNVGNGSK